MSKSFIIVSCLLLVVSLTSCAKTVTQVNFGSTMLVTVTLRGNADIANNRYFMVLSADQNFKAPLPPLENSGYYEFLDLASNTLPVDNSHPLADYYANFFTTWAGYVKLDTSGYAAVPGPFTSSLEAIPGATSITGTGLGTNTLSFNFQLTQIFATVPSTVYFDVITVPWTAGQQKIPADHINASNLSIATLSGSTTGTITDLTDYGVSSDPSLDILNCKVTVQ